jgi:hypothetical protein
MAKRAIGRSGAALACGIALALPAASVASASTTTARATPKAQCVTTNPKYSRLAVQMAHAIDNKLVGRTSTVGLEMSDTRTSLTCTYHAKMHFYAASAIKATILASLLRKAQEEHRSLTSSEKSLAWLMITESDNSAAQSLWEDVGISWVQHFLGLAKMKETQLNDAWGLSLLTAHDEVLLLKVLSTDNHILTAASRRYERFLMAHVTSSQRWGTPFGAPKTVVVHVKNGWLPYPGANWEINSLGIFTAVKGHRVYVMAVLTHDNPSELYGIDTIEDAAEAMHRHLNPGTRAALEELEYMQTRDWGMPDQPLGGPGW